jgi:indolepyruvate ferredoxin oxidoreductase beta subunit
VRIVDYFKPGVPEIAGLLPARLSTRLARWEDRRRAAGKAPLGLALHVRTDGIGGFLALRALAALRRWRPHGARHAQEQALIERWLRAIEATAREDWACGYEVALSGRLIKGYGATNERGKNNLVHIVDHLALAPGLAAPQRAAAIRTARIAALADETGRALDAVLAQHGAPARPVRVQPIIWARGPVPRRAKRDAKA